MFGYNSFTGSGLIIKWVDEPSETKEPVTNTRLNLKDENGNQDTKPWRFTKV